MLAITKTEKPEFFGSWLKDNKRYTQELRDYILKKEQTHVCCYCEKELTPANSDSHVEHIKPQSKFPELKHKYLNLVVSCQTPGRCGNAKGSQFHEDFIIQTEEDPAQYLTYRPDGRIIPIESNPKGEKTIEILNLNSAKLVKARRTLIKQLQSTYQTLDQFDEFMKYFKPNPTLLDYFRTDFFPNE
jgi:uncharacterized protein (TIGR02646 family)